MRPHHERAAILRAIQFARIAKKVGKKHARKYLKRHAKSMRDYQMAREEAALNERRQQMRVNDQLSAERAKEKEKKTLKEKTKLRVKA